MSSAQLARLGAIAVLTAAGCGQNAPAAEPAVYAGKISGDWTGGSALGIAYGRRWAIAGNTPVGSAGEFRVPSWARAMAAYVDANRNGRFDRFAEPSGDCRLTEHEWSCSIALRRATLHRSITRRAADHHDKTYVFWEDYRSDGTSLDGSQLCVEHRCTSSEPPPFLFHSDAKARLFSICGEEGFAPVDAEVRGLAEKLTVPLARPADLAASVTVDATAAPQTGRADADLRLNIASPAVDRVLVWAGHVDARSGETLRVYWTSEDSRFDIADTRGGMAARLPATDVELCRRDPDCEIVVQLLRYWSPPEAPVVSSTGFRSTVAFRGQP
jgi:hypothetical protein